jgi:hypothetical protein
MNMRRLRENVLAGTNPVTTRQLQLAERRVVDLKIELKLAASFKPRLKL